MKRYMMRLRYRQLGGHTHIAVFTGPLGMTLGKAGDLVLTNDEFRQWLQNGIVTEFVDEDAREAKNKA